jgi:hypothetical protein
MQMCSELLWVLEWLDGSAADASCWSQHWLVTGNLLSDCYRKVFIYSVCDVMSMVQLFVISQFLLSIGAVGALG